MREATEAQQLAQSQRADCRSGMAVVTQKRDNTAQGGRWTRGAAGAGVSTADCPRPAAAAGTPTLRSARVGRHTSKKSFQELEKGTHEQSLEKSATKANSKRQTESKSTVVPRCEGQERKQRPGWEGAPQDHIPSGGAQTQRLTYTLLGLPRKGSSITTRRTEICVSSRPGQNEHRNLRNYLIAQRTQGETRTQKR